MVSVAVSIEFGGYRRSKRVSKQTAWSVSEFALPSTWRTVICAATETFVPGLPLPAAGRAESPALVIPVYRAERVVFCEVVERARHVGQEAGEIGSDHGAAAGLEEAREGDEIIREPLRHPEPNQGLLRIRLLARIGCGPMTPGRSGPSSRYVEG